MRRQQATVAQVNTEMRSFTPSACVEESERISVGICGAQTEETIDGTRR